MTATHAFFIFFATLLSYTSFPFIFHLQFQYCSDIQSLCKSILDAGGDWKTKKSTILVFFLRPTHFGFAWRPTTCREPRFQFGSRLLCISADARSVFVPLGLG